MKALSSFFSAVGGGCWALGRMRTSWGEPLSADLRSLPLLRALSQLFSVALTHLKLGQAPSQDLLLSKTPKSSTPLPALSSPLSPQPFHPFVFFFFFPFLFFSFLFHLCPSLHLPAIVPILLLCPAHFVIHKERVFSTSGFQIIVISTAFKNIELAAGAATHWKAVFQCFPTRTT